MDLSQIPYQKVKITMENQPELSEEAGAATLSEVLEISFNYGVSTRTSFHLLFNDWFLNCLIGIY